MRCLLIFVLLAHVGFGQIPPYVHKMDSVPQAIIGDWYLSGTSFYESEYTEGKEFYVAADDVYRLRVTRDSIYFVSPPSRFYRSVNNGYKFTLIYDSVLREMELTAFHQHRKKSSDFKRFTIEYGGSELRLKEWMSSGGLDEIHVMNCQIYRPTVDSTHLEEKLLGSWQTSFEWEETELKPNDTIVLYRKDLHIHHFDGIQLNVQLKKGVFTGSMEQSIKITQNESDNSSPIQGIVDGVYLYTMGNCSIDPMAYTMTIQSEYEKYFFSILSVTEDKLALIFLERTQIKPYRLNYRD